MSPLAAAPAVAIEFGALHHRDYRRDFLLALVGMTLGAWIGVETSLALSAAAVVAVALGLLVTAVRAQD